MTPSGQFTKCDFFFPPLPVLFWGNWVLFFITVSPVHVQECGVQGLRVVFQDGPCPILGRGIWVRGFLASSGLRPVEAFPDTRWGPWH